MVDVGWAARGVLVVGLVSGVAGCGSGADDPTVVVGVLPDGMSYEVRLSGDVDPGEPEGIGGVPVWAEPSELAGTAVGRVRYLRDPDLAPLDASADRLHLEPAEGGWVLVIDLYEHSLDRRSELEGISAAIGPGGLIAVDLPPTLRWAEEGELPSQIDVTYRDFRVVRGCREGAVCSADRRVSVVAVSDTFHIADVDVVVSG